MARPILPPEERKQPISLSLSPLDIKLLEAVRTGLGVNRSEAVRRGLALLAELAQDGGAT